jgi:ST7 protein
MPVSKKPRRKRSNPLPAKPAIGLLPDRRAMEGVMSAIGESRSEDATAQAQDVMYDAWEQTNRRARVALAHKALAISPLCADAYVLLAEESGPSLHVPGAAAQTGTVSVTIFGQAKTHLL